jgi:hypothetical protein
MSEIKNPKRIKPLDIEIYKKGECFICGKSCDSYAHYECCIAYSRHADLKQKEENINSGN